MVKDVKEILLDDFWIMPATPEYIETGVPYITSKNIKNGKIDFDKANYISLEAYEAISKNRPILVGDILISMIGTLGETAEVTLEDGMFYGQNMFLIRLDESVVNKRYFLNYFKSDLVKRALAGKQNQSTQKYLKANHIEDLQIPILSLKEQECIAEILDKIQNIIINRKQELQKLDDLIKARFVELFGKGNHEIVKAAEVCDFITKGTTPPTGEITEEYVDGKIPFLKVYNLSFTGEMLFDENPQYIPKEIHNGKLARSKVYPNDVLMNIVGPPLGKFAIVTNEFDEWNINQAIAIFRAKERIFPRFLLDALMQPKVLEPFVGQAVGIRQQNLSLEQCRNLQFPLPSLEEQKIFVDFAEQVDKSKFVCIHNISYCKQNMNICSER